MLQHFADNMTDLLVKKEIVNSENREIYVYGFEALFSTLLNTILIIATGLLTGLFVETLTYLIAFGVLRMYCGGYHAHTHLKCIILSFLAYGAAMVFTIILPGLVKSETNIFPILIGGLSLIYILKYAPIEHKNRPFTPKERKNFRKLAIIISIIEFSTICVINLFMMDQLKTALVISMAMLSVVFVLAMARLKTEREVNIND